VIFRMYRTISSKEKRVKMVTHIRLVPRLGMSGVVSSPPYLFEVTYSIKCKDNFTFNFYPSLVLF
jgi:hypothetical protein